MSLLQVEYQHNVHLIRGNHEAADINALFGFRVECIERMVLVSMPCFAVLMMLLFGRFNAMESRCGIE